MEMIAMLGGLGAAGELSPAARAAGNAITFAKTVDELAAISAGLPNMGLSKEEELVLKVMIDKRTQQILNPTPFYHRAWFWGLVLVGGAAWYHRDKIADVFRGSLQGLSAARYDKWQDPKYLQFNRLRNKLIELGKHLGEEDQNLHRMASFDEYRRMQAAWVRWKRSMGVTKPKWGEWTLWE